MSFDFELVNKDLKISTDGSVKTITDTPKLRQEIIKIILTPIGSLKQHPWYGCAVAENIIGVPLDNTILESQLVSDVNESLERLQSLQKSQALGQKVTLAEIIETIVDVHGERNVEDPRLIEVVVTVLSKRLSKIEEYFMINSQ